VVVAEADVAAPSIPVTASNRLKPSLMTHLGQFLAIEGLEDRPSSAMAATKFANPRPITEIITYVPFTRFRLRAPPEDLTGMLTEARSNIWSAGLSGDRAATQVCAAVASLCDLVSGEEPWL